MTLPTPAGSFVVLVLSAAIAVSAPFAQAQSKLADFARAERERRAALLKEAAPVTNETLAAKGLLSPTAPSTGAKPETNTPETAKKPAEPETKKTDEHGEQWWRAQFATARENVTRSEAEAQSAEAQMKKTANEFLIRSDIYNKEGQMGPQLRTLGTEVEASKKRVDEAKKKLADLEEELRRSGGLPGWAR